MILVFSEDDETALEALANGRELADSLKSELAAVSLGGNEESYIAYGADKVFSTVLEPHADSIVEFISMLIDRYRPEILLIGGTKPGKEVAPRVAQRLGVGCATDCVEFSLEQGKLVTRRYVLGGRFIAVQRFLRNPQIATVPPRRFLKKEDKTRKGEIIKTSFKPAEPKVQVLEIKEKGPGALRIEEADIIVSAGRGFRKKEDLKLVFDLAEALGGVVGCSRSIAADLKWLPEERWVGLSGHKIKPRLYIAIGISGQVQHIAGIRDSRTIIAINSDANAPIFKACDYGIVGDLYEIVPRLTEMVKKRAL